jgi:uncharacterized protein YndB with AHSA1/START domain
VHDEQVIDMTRDTSDTLLGVIHRTPTMNEVHFERHYDVPPEKLWSFIEDPKLLAKWAGHVDKFQLDIGGEIVFIHYVPGATATITCKVTELKPGRLVAMTWDVPAWGTAPGLHSPAMLGTTMRWEVRPDENGSTFLLTHALPNVVGKEHVLSAAWHLHLNQLALLLAGEAEAQMQVQRMWGLILSYLDTDFAEKVDYYADLLGQIG